MFRLRKCRILDKDLTVELLSGIGIHSVEGYSEIPRRIFGRTRNYVPH